MSKAKSSAILATTLLLALHANAPSGAAQCPPYGAICSGLTCGGTVAGYCCCAPYCNVQPNGTLKCGCQNSCATSCDKTCSGECKGGPCYAGGGETSDTEVTPVGFRLADRAARAANLKPYGILITSALDFFTGDGSRALHGTWTGGGTVESSTLGEPWASQPNRYVAFKAVWNATADKVQARIVFADPLDTPAPVSVTIRSNGRLAVRPLSAAEVDDVLASTDAQAWPEGGPVIEMSGFGAR